MFLKKLVKYKNADHFFFKPEDSLSQSCNAPKKGSGIYLVFIAETEAKELIYIGRSGCVQNDGKIKHRKGGLNDRIVNGKQFDKPRRTSWPSKMKEENIKELEICWYETFNYKVKDIPAYVEAKLLQRFFEINGRLPNWNKEF